MNKCIFCKINSGEIAGQIIAENDLAKAFLDAQPLSKGHTIVVPKRHAETILDLETAELHGLFDLVKIVTAQIEEKLQPDGFNIGANMHKAAGQAVEHLHLHIIPRWRGDGGGSIHSIIKNPPTESLNEVLRQIQD